MALGSFRTDMLESLSGERKLYHTENGDSVSVKMRKSIDVPNVLALKIRAPVILTVNLSQSLVNGLSGVVKVLNDDSVDVYFHLLKQKHTIAMHSFFQFNCHTNSHMLVVKQIPLILSFAMTVHKSQGMTLKNVFLDCRGAFDAGQISVALGRVENPSQITVKNFRPSLCPPHSPKINTYYGLPTKFISPDLNCCRDHISVMVAVTTTTTTTTTMIMTTTTLAMKLMGMTIMIIIMTLKLELLLDHVFLTTLQLG